MGAGRPSVSFLGMITSTMSGRIGSIALGAMLRFLSYIFLMCLSKDVL